MSHRMFPQRPLMAALASGILASVLLSGPSFCADPYKLGVEQQGYLDNPLQGGANYPAPRMIPQTPTAGTRPPLQGGAQQRPPLQGGATQRPPIQAGVQQRVVLPPDFIGLWNVSGQRT